MENIGLKINGEYLSHSRFVDDIVSLSETADRMQTMLEDFQPEITAVELKINMNKLK